MNKEDFDKATSHLAKGIAKAEDEKIIEMMNNYAELERTSIPVNTIICGACGNVVHFADKNTKLCEHQKKMVEGLEGW